MAKLVDARDLKSLGLNIRAGSTPALGTKESFGAVLSLRFETKIYYAQMAKLVDARDLKSLGLNIRAGSTPALGTKH